MGAGRCVRSLLGGCLTHFWWGDQGVLGFGHGMGSIFRGDVDVCFWLGLGLEGGN